MDYNIVWHVFVVGFAILIGAIIVNILAGVLGLNTWYSFAIEIGKSGFFSALKGQGVVSLLFLFVVYPFLLGLIGYYSARFFL